jgi:hypothetical protein
MVEGGHSYFLVERISITAEDSVRKLKKQRPGPRGAVEPVKKKW